MVMEEIHGVTQGQHNVECQRDDVVSMRFEGSQIDLDRT